MKSEFEKLVEKDVQVENHKQNMNKVHEIAKMQKKGKHPVTLDVPSENHVLFLEIDRKLNIHWECWDTGGKCEARKVEITKFE